MSDGSLSSFCPDASLSASLCELQARFVCQKCGKCCRVGGNPVLTYRDITNVAIWSNVDPFDPSLVPVKQRTDGSGLFDLTITSPCFYQDKVTGECSVHDAKPQNCREWPFISLARGMCKLEHVLVCPEAIRLLNELLGVPCPVKSVVAPSVPRCLHQRADVVTCSVICVVNNNSDCPFAGNPDKSSCLGFVLCDPQDHKETGLP